MKYFPIFALLLGSLALSGCRTVSGQKFSAKQSTYESQIDGYSTGNLNATRQNGLNNKVYFETDSSQVDESGHIALSNIAQHLKKRGDSPSVIIEGHCDERGTVDYNLGLGERRANSAKVVLQQKGVPQTCISTVSRGKGRATGGCLDKERMSLDRNASVVER